MSDSNDSGVDQERSTARTESPQEAGRALDALVAEKVMGMQRYGAIRYGERCVVLVKEHNDCWQFTRTQRDPGTWEATTEPITEWRGIPDYSTDISAAWLVVDRLRSQGYGITLSDVRAYFWTCEVDRDTWRGSEVWTAPTAPLAICRAALAAVEAT